jgi:type III restriction enzyme
VNAEVNVISSRLSLRTPQRRSLEILDTIMRMSTFGANFDPEDALAAIRGEFPTVTEFEREFPSLCFALATGVGKTRLMGAFITYLNRAHRIANFFILAPSLTVYNKLIADFTPNTPKYVFKGVAEFATNPPGVITGDNYQEVGTLLDELTTCKINIFNISKINAEVRGGRAPRIKRLSEYIGTSYFEYLASLPDLVLLMDESHRYRASAGVRAINELRPLLGLELTATPFVESATGPVPFRNVVFDYPLARAMEDGFVKEPAVATRKDFTSKGMTAAQIEQIKLEDGVRLHEATKVELATYAGEHGLPVVKPFILIIARDTTHASDLQVRIASVDFFNGRYAGKVIQVDSSRTGAEEEAMVSRLLQVESPDEPTEIVIHVNMLKEGWDVTNLYTIVPLRAANARTLIEQSIGRGLRLPYGRRTGVEAVDRLSIVAHDRFQEIVDEARRPDSPIRLKQLILDPAEMAESHETVSALPNVLHLLGLGASPAGDADGPKRGSGGPGDRAFDPGLMPVVRLTYAQVLAMTRRPDLVPTLASLAQADVVGQLVATVTANLVPAQQQLDVLAGTPDVRKVVDDVVAAMIQGTIDIPRILVVPTGEVSAGFHHFRLDLSAIRYPVPSKEIHVQSLRTGSYQIVSPDSRGFDENRSVDYVVGALIDFDDVSYDRDSELLYDLAQQVVDHLENYLASPEDAKRVLAHHERDIARLVHSQMGPHYWEESTGYEVRVSQGFTPLKEMVFTGVLGAGERNFREAPPDKSQIGRYVFGGFTRCLYRQQKFQSDPERVLAVILERESLRWFKPARGQFQIFYRDGSEHREYQPDFVAEMADELLMLEPKMSSQLKDPIVLAKKTAAEAWCQRAGDYAALHDGKPWRYVLIPHDRITENMTLAALGRSGDHV